MVHHPSVTLNRVQRDATRGFIVDDFFGVDGERLTHGGDIAEARHAIWRLAVGVRVVDQLGWEQDSDRDSYELEVDDDIARFMRELGREAGDTDECAKDRVTVEAAAVVVAAFKGAVV